MDKIEIIKRPIERELSEFKALFDAALTSTAPILGDVLGYIRKRNGKMMRPMLVLLMAKLYGKINPATLHSALSLELLHTARSTRATNGAGKHRSMRCMITACRYWWATICLPQACAMLLTRKKLSWSTWWHAWGRTFRKAKSCSWRIRAIPNSLKRFISMLSARRPQPSLRQVPRAVRFPLRLRRKM